MQELADKEITIYGKVEAEIISSDSERPVVNKSIKCDAVGSDPSRIPRILTKDLTDNSGTLCQT